MKQSNRPLTTARLILDALVHNLGVALLLVTFIVFSVVLTVLPPLALEKAVDGLTVSQAITLRLAFVYFGLSAAAGISDVLREVLITVTGQRINHSIRSAMCAKLTRLPADYFVKNEPAAVTSRFVNDVDQLETLFTSGVVSMIADALKVFSILIAVFTKSLGLGLLLLAFTPLILVFTRAVQKRMLLAQYDNRVAVAKVNRIIPETLRSLRTVHTLHTESFMRRRYGAAIEESFRAMERSVLYDSFFSPTIVTLGAFITGLLMTVSASGAGAASFFGMGVGTAVAITAYVAKIFEPLEAIGMEIQNIQSAMAGIKRIDEFLAQEEREVFAKDHYQPVPGADTVAVDDISFSYDGERDILKDFSCRISQGENVTVTGRTGAGKSTLFKLLLGLYRPQSGSVTIHGVQASQVPDAVRRGLVGYVEQTFHLIPGTVRQQITLGDSTITEQQVDRAVAIAGLSALLESFPQGLDTPVKEEMFSQGELQLLAIARAVASDPQILLLDEITANLDSSTEARVLAALKEAARNRTVLSISHRVYEVHGGREVHL